MKAVTWPGRRDVRVDTVQGMGATLFEYTKLCGARPGGQVEFLKVLLQP